MKKKYLKYLLFAICLCIFNFDNVFAYNARVGTTSSRSTGEAQGYYDIAIYYNGKEYKQAGYCANEHLHLPEYYDQDTGKNDQMNFYCQEENNPEIYSILTSGGSHGDKQSQLWSYSQNGTINTASNGGALLTKIGENGHTITYAINPTIDVKSLSVTCGTGCASAFISGTTLTVTLQENACSFTINVSYSGPITNSTISTTSGRVLHCWMNSDRNQDVYMPLGESSKTTDKTNLTFSDSLDRCDEKPNKCNEKTEIIVPAYCDDPNDEQITIIAPKNVKYCILNGRDDAGNTYKMDDGQIKNGNPYCAVYCKEDYEMTMPGAQYTDSGRYFKLKNTIVKATRTCYTTNPSGDPEKTNIDIKQFIADVKAAQEAIVAAKNEYEYAKAFNDAEEKDVEVTCDHKIENGIKKDITSTRYSKSFDYKVYSLGGYNTQTGEYTTIKESTEHADLSWGGCYAGTKPKVLDPGTALANLNAAVNRLKEKIEHMEDCYNWKNNLCMNTEVQFDYNEQYNTSINYQLVSGGGTFSSDSATYNTSETIDNNYSANSGGNLNNYNYIHCDANSCNRSNVAERISTLVQELYHRKIEVSGSAEYANIQEFQTNYPHGTIDTVADQSALRYNYSYLGAVFPVALNTPTGVYKWTLNFSKLGQYNDDACRNGRLDDVIRSQGKSVGAGLEYVCVYVVDCDDCDYECVGEGCLIPDDKCPECDVYCTNCIFDGDGFTFNYRMIGDDTNPNERTMGSNWENEKGQAVLKEIESLGEEVYIEDQYTYYMGPDNQKRIRDYNKQTGTYVAEDLDFHDVGDIKNAYGTSSFLDNGERNGFFKEKKRNKNWRQWGNIGNNMGPALS